MSVPSTEKVWRLLRCIPPLGRTADPYVVVPDRRILFGESLYPDRERGCKFKVGRHLPRSTLAAATSAVPPSARPTRCCCSVNRTLTSLPDEYARGNVRGGR